MSANVVDGLSLVYALARLRAMDITLPIWPCARRCIQMTRPTKMPTIRRIGNRLANHDERGGENLASGTFVLMDSVTPSGSGTGASVVNFWPFFNSPLIDPVELS